MAADMEIRRKYRLKIYNGRRATICFTLSYPFSIRFMRYSVFDIVWLGFIYLYKLSNKLTIAH